MADRAAAVLTSIRRLFRRLYGHSPWPAATTTGRDRVGAFVALSFGLAWIIWVGGLAGNRRGRSDLLGETAQAIVLAGSFAPAIAAVIVRSRFGREGFADAGMRPDLRRGRWVYLVALAGPLAVGAATVGGAVALGLSRPDPSMERVRRSMAMPVAESTQFSSFLPFALVSTLPSAFLLWGEEFGWRGYLQARIGGGPIASAVATGTIWAVWHYPLVLWGYGTFGQAPRWFGLILYPLLCIPLSGFFGWLRDASGDTWAPSLAHAVHNNVAAAGVGALFAGGPNFVPVVLLLVPGYCVLWAFLQRRWPATTTSRLDAGGGGA